MLVNPFNWISQIFSFFLNIILINGNATSAPHKEKPKDHSGLDLILLI